VAVAELRELVGFGIYRIAHEPPVQELAFLATVARQRSSEHAADRSRYPRLHPQIIHDDIAVLGFVDQP
jgi:hypothetical protein